ncbi:MAG: hypothetical protein ACO3A4_08590 [Silvanigrellaceae bacterium]
MKNSIVCFGVVFGLVACGQSEFNSTPGPKRSTTKKSSGAESVGANGTNSANGEGVGGQKQETFTVSSLTGKVDIAWYVDQSGSMTKEAQHVQNNLASFFNLVGKEVDARYALVANSTGSNAIKIPVEDANHIQINQSIASNNALEIAISSFLAADLAAQPPLDANNPAGAKVTKAPIQGTLKNFFRPGVLPVVVIVTDDNAKRVNETNFLALAKDALGVEPKLYAWRGNSNLPAIPGAQCDVAANGVAYEQLAAKTGGEVFNLCEPDWTSSFAKLTQNIVQAAKNSFALKVSPKSIVSVTIDGKAIDNSKVTLSGNIVTIAASELSAISKGSVVITYQ